MSRGGLKISRNGVYDYAAGERVSWIDQFANNIDAASKTAVEVARTRSQQSILDQIQSLMNGNSAHATVESKVQDLQERVGLHAYLNKLEANKEQASKTASQEGIFQSVDSQLRDEILNFIKNTIATHRGRIHVPAVQEDVLSTFKTKGLKPEDVHNTEVATYINDAIASELKMHPQNDMYSADIGRGVGVEDVEVDEMNSDFFHGLLPDKDM